MWIGKWIRKEGTRAKRRAGERNAKGGVAVKEGGKARKGRERSGAFRGRVWGEEKGVGA